MSVNEWVYPYFDNYKYPDKDKRDREDARKFYVAMSRTKKRLFFSYHMHNQGYSKKYGYNYDKPSQISTFVRCIRNYFE